MHRRMFVAHGLASAAALVADRWSTSRQPSRTLDVRQFGARGDGRTDDTSAFDAALLAAKSLGAEVLVPVGRYITSRIIHIPSGVTLRGDGETSILEWQGTGDRIVLAAVGANEVRITSLAIRGTVSHGVVLQNCIGAILERCSLSGATVRRSAYSSGVLVVASKDVTITGCRFSGNGGSGVSQGSDIQVEGLGQRSSRIHILKNECLSTDAAVNIRCYDMADSVIADNIASGARLRGPSNHGYGVMIYQTVMNPGSCSGNSVLRNKVSHTDGTGIYLQQSNSSTVVENEVDQTGAIQDDTSLPVAGVALNQCESSSVLRNRISRSGHAGISVSSNREGAGHLHIEGNVVTGSTGPGVHLRGSLTDVTVENNEIRDTRGGIVSYSDVPQHQLQLVGNTIAACRGGAHAILTLNADRSSVRGNRISECGPAPVNLTFSDSSSTESLNTITGDGVGTTAITVRRIHRDGRGRPSIP